MFLLQNGVYFFALGLFIAGTILHMSGRYMRTALWLMTAGVIIDFFATVLPHTGFKSLVIGIDFSASIVCGIFLGVSTWVIFLSALFVRLSGRTRLFHRLIIAIAVIWSLNLALCLYGIAEL